MGWVLKDFKCGKCGVTERLVEFNTTQLVCCGQTAHSLISAPRVVGADSFNAHFDITQGQYFESANQKRNWLASKEKEQMEGSLSPRCSGGGRVICSRTQAKQLTKARTKRIDQKEIPGLITNRRTSVAFSRPDAA